MLNVYGKSLFDWTKNDIEVFWCKIIINLRCVYKIDRLFFNHIRYYLRLWDTIDLFVISLQMRIWDRQRLSIYSDNSDNSLSNDIN